MLSTSGGQACRVAHSDAIWLASRVGVHHDPATQLSAYPRPMRQLAVTGLGHDQPTLLITNRPALPALPVIQAYACRPVKTGVTRRVSRSAA